MINMVKLPTNKSSLFLRVAKGHFATSHSQMCIRDRYTAGLFDRRLFFHENLSSVCPSSVSYTHLISAWHLPTARCGLLPADRPPSGSSCWTCLLYTSRVVFVCAMWLTGFDVKCLSCLYLDKPLKAHTLMQTLSLIHIFVG